MQVVSIILYRGGFFCAIATSHKGELAHLYGDCRDPVERSGTGCAIATSHKGELAHLYGDCRDPVERSKTGCAIATSQKGEVAEIAAFYKICEGRNQYYSGAGPGNQIIGRGIFIPQL